LYPTRKKYNMMYRKLRKAIHFSIYKLHIFLSFHRLYPTKAVMFLLCPVGPLSVPIA